MPSVVGKMTKGAVFSAIVNAGDVGDSGVIAITNGGTGIYTIPVGTVLAANTANTLNLVTSTTGSLVLTNSGGTITWAAGGGSYTNEEAQDAVGSMIDTTLVYVDATPLLTRGALTGDVTCPTGSNITTISEGTVTLTKMASVSTSKVFYRKTAGTGAPEVNTLATLKTDLGLTGTNSGDQTTIVGITGTKAQFDTAVTDGNILYVGDAYVPGGTDVAVADGGTGFSTIAAGSALVCNTANTINIVTATTGSTVLTNSAGTITWAAAGAGGVPTTITVADTTDSTAFVALFESATGDLGPKTDAAITYNATTGSLAVTSITSNLTGDVNLTAAPGSDHTASGVKIVLTANESQAIGDACYINSTGKAQLGDADAIATAGIVAMCADATISSAASGNYLLIGVIRDDTWAWTVGGFIYLSTTGTTGNTLTQTQPSGANDIIQIIGVATHADRMLFNPNLTTVEHV
jgi:hypothetical protein